MFDEFFKKDATASFSADVIQLNIVTAPILHVPILQ